MSSKQEINISHQHLMSVIIYTTPTCPYCKTVKQYFGEQGISYEEKDVAASDGAREEMLKKSGALAVPVIDIDGTVIVGFDKLKIKEALKRV